MAMQLLKTDAATEKRMRDFAQTLSEKKELDQLQDDPTAGRVRRPGAGRKKRSNRSRAKKKI